jgi:hypothetical protein
LERFSHKDARVVIWLEFFSILLENGGMSMSQASNQRSVIEEINEETSAQFSAS